MIIMSTNYATAKYQEIYDINTVSNSVSVIGIHTPVGAKPRQMLSGFFTQFRKYKYRGCSVVATPAQRLGLNLAELSAAAGTSAVNPKDVFNPALVRGCHGDNLNAALNSIYKGSFTSEGSSIGEDRFTKSVIPSGTLSWEQMYYRMLQDPSFKKFNLSSGIKIAKLHPMVYNVASNHQILPSENNQYIGNLQPGTGNDDEVGFQPGTFGGVSNGAGTTTIVSKYPQFMTNRLQSLGWMDTRQILQANASSSVPGFTVLPKIFMAVIVLPPALSANVVTSMRFVVTHYFEFKEFNTSLTLEGASEYYDWLTVVSSKSSDDQDEEKLLNDTFDTIGAEDSVEVVSDGVY